MRTKRNLERIRIENARSIIERIPDWSESEIDEVLAERILNSLDFLIKKHSRYSEEKIKIEPVQGFSFGGILRSSKTVKARKWKASQFSTFVS